MFAIRGGPAISLFSRVAAAACQGVFLILLARTVSLADFGVYSTICAIGAICIGLFGMGLPARALQIRPEQLDIGGSYLAAAGFLSAASCAVALLASAYMVGHISWIAIAATCFTAAELQNNIAQSYLYALKRNWEADVFTVLRRLLPLLAVSMAIFLDLKESAFPLVALGFLAAWVLGSARFIGQYNFSNLRRHVVGGGFNYWLINLWSMAQQVDVILINAFFGSHLSGLYASAVRLASPVHIITSVITSRLVPNLRHARNRRSHDLLWRQLYNPLKMVILCSLVASSALYWVAPIIFDIPKSPVNLIYIAAFAAAAFSLLSQVLSAALYTQGGEASVQRYTRTSVFAGLTLVAVGGYFESFAIAGSGILCSQLILTVLLAKEKSRVSYA